VTYNSLRQHFPFFQHSSTRDWIYLDSAATTQKPKAVIDTISDFYTWQNTNVHRSSYDLADFATEQFERVRSDVASFIGANQPKEVIFTQGTTDSINLVAQCFGSRLGADDEILISEMEHHANIVPWQLLQQRMGFTIKAIPLTKDNMLDVSAYQQLLSKKTKLVCITQMSNALGVITPIKQLIDIAHSVGAKVLIDGAQGAAHLSINVAKLNADFYAFSGHKMYGPTGIGILFGKEELLDSMPPYRGGGEMIKKVSFSGTTFNELPFKFEAGTPNIAGVLGLGAAIKFIEENRTTIETIEHGLYERLVKGLNSIAGLRLLTPSQNSAAIASFTLNNHHHDLALLLNEKKIATRSGHHCAMPLMQSLKLPGTVRASIACYNNEQDIDGFLNALEAISQGENSLTEVLMVQSNKPSNKAVELLSTLKGRDAKIRQLMLWGKNLPSPNQALRLEEYLVQGCESDAWLKASISDQSIHFEFDADARIVRGLGYLLMEMVNGLKCEQISKFDFEQQFKQLEINKLLSPSRSNGVRAIIDKMRQLALT